MTWRQIAPELFYLGNNPDKIQAIVTLQHLGVDSQPDGMTAQIFVDNHCYVLALRQVDPDGKFPDFYKFKLITHWFWEAVQALKELPNPDTYYELPEDHLNSVA